MTKALPGACTLTVTAGALLLIQELVRSDHWAHDHAAVCLPPVLLW